MDFTDFRSLYDKILIQDLPVENKGGLILSASAAALVKATVISVGDECHEKITVGSTILYKKDDAQETVVDGAFYKMLRQKDIWI